MQLTSKVVLLTGARRMGAAIADRVTSKGASVVVTYRGGSADADAVVAAARARGVQGLAVRVARALNRAMKRTGAVFRDRYHSRVLGTPRQVRNTPPVTVVRRRTAGPELREVRCPAIVRPELPRHLQRRHRTAICLWSDRGRCCELSVDLAAIGG